MIMYIKKMITISESSLSEFNQQCELWQKDGFVPLSDIIVTHHPGKQCLYYTQQLFLPDESIIENDGSIPNVFGNFNE